MKRTAITKGSVNHPGHLSIKIPGSSPAAI